MKTHVDSSIFPILDTNKLLLEAWLTFQILEALLATQAGSKLDNFDKSTSVNGKVLYNINKVWEKVFSNFSRMFLNPNIFFQFEF